MDVFAFAANAAIPIGAASKASELTFRSGAVIVGKEAFSEAVGWAGSEVTGWFTDNEQAKMIAGMASSFLGGNISNKVDNYFNLSRKPFLSGMSADDVARYDDYWRNLGIGSEKTWSEYLSHITITVILMNILK